MEQKLDELLKQIHRYLFADSDQVIVELKQYMLDRSLKEAELAFISAKIFNSKESLLQFLRENHAQNERILATVKKRIYELIIDYMKLRKQEVSHYLQEIKETCMISFFGDPNYLVKEAGLQVLIKIIESFDVKELLPIIQPVKLLDKLLDEIKLRKPSASVKGAIWTLVGLLHQKYDNLVNERLVESQDVCLMSLQDQVRANKPEMKAIIGMVKGLTFMLSAGCTLNDRELQQMYIMIKTIIKSQRNQEDKEMNNRGIMKAGMKLLSQHANLITDQILKDALDLIKETLKLCVIENIEVRDSANELLFSLLNTISDSLQSNQDAHVELFRHIMSQFDEILNANDYRNMQLLSAIRAVGIFSKAIKRINGDDKLWDYLERLTEISEQKLIKEFMDQQNPESDLHNFKYILKKQKQLIAYIESYSFIIRNLSREPSEKQLQHFMKIGSIGVNNHRKLYHKYRYRFYESLAQLSMSLSGFSGLFGHWMKKFVRLSLTETLKIPDSVIFGGESPVESLNDAVQFWCHYLQKEEIWAIDACQTVYDELINTALNDIDSIDLSYKVQKITLDREDFSVTQQTQFEVAQAESQQKGVYNKNTVEYIANNQNDQSYLVRLTNFLEGFLPQCHESWLIKWVPNICQAVVKKSTQTPRISKLYTLLKTVLGVCSRQKYFDRPIMLDCTGLVGEQVDLQLQRQAQMESERLNTYNMLLTFLKELIGKSEEFQDNLLTAVMEMLLHVPISVLYTSPQTRLTTDKSMAEGSQNENIHLWKGVMIKALELSRINNKLAMTCIKMLEQWFNTLPVSVTAELYSDVVPKLSDFLIITESQLGKSGEINPDEDYFERDGEYYTETYFFQQKLIEEREELRKIDRRDIANKVLDLLGKIGGHAHSIINNELSKKHDKENVIRWDTEKRVKLMVPLHTSKLEIYLDSCLPRIVDLAQNSTDKLTRIAACELLHALILYMIGKSATNPVQNGKKGTKRFNQEQAQADSTAFAKLYAKLFPVIIRLATEIEQISRQLFEPLCFQIVRWFSSCKIYENAAVESLLDALIDGAQSRNNSTLREMCSNAVAVFAEWSLKNETDEASDGQSNIKSLVRRIESNSSHPDPFKRLSAVLCFSKIFAVIKDQSLLIDQFCLEITRCVLGSLKMCHNSLEFSQEVIDNCSQLLKVIEKQITANIQILLKPNAQRSLHASLHEFLDFLFSKFISIETVYRHECMALWEGLVTSLPQPKGQTQSLSKTIQNWIKTRYVPKQGKPIYWNLVQIEFASGAVDKGTIGLAQTDSRRGRLLEAKKCFDSFAAQLEFVHWLLKVAKFSFGELKSGLKINIEIVAMNLGSMFENVIWPTFKKISDAAQNQKSFSLTKLLVCKEDKEQLTKSKIRMLTKLFTLANFLDDESLKKFIGHASDEDVEMDGNGSLDECMFDLALQICLVPACHQLQLLVQDVQLEKTLREQVELYIKRKFADLSAKDQVSAFDEEPSNLLEILQQRIIPKLPFTDLNVMFKAQSGNNLQPRLLASLTQGYLNLGAIDRSLKNHLITLASQNLQALVDESSSGSSPLENDSCRILVNFMSKLKISNQTLFSWLTEKYQIYQKTSDLLLSYIAENWQTDPEQVGDYIINKAGEDMKILQVFIPIIQYISEHKPGYQRVLLKKIPEHWKSVNFTEGYAENQVKIYSLIVSKCKWTLENPQDQEAGAFINFICIQIMTFLNNTKFSVYLKKQVLNLAGLLYDLKLPDSRTRIHLKLKDSLLHVQKEFFPIKTRELAKHSNKAINFEHIVEGFLDLVELSKNLDVFRMLYKCIREMKPSFFSERLKGTVNSLITQSINPSSPDLFIQTVDGFMQEFASSELDKSIDDNIRWAIAHKVIQRILETCSLDQLESLIVKYFQLFRGILDKPLVAGPVAVSEEQQHENAVKRYMVVREKTHVFLFLETMVRRLDSEVLKGRVTQQIFGSQCQANELTRYLILTSNEAKQQRLERFFDHKIDCELPVLNSSEQVHRRYNCAAYTLLSSVIFKTQTKEHLFTSYLFKNQRVKESVWELLVDCSSEEVYNFVVQTNFNFINLKAYEHKSNAASKPFNRANLMIQEYVTTSFLSANEKFNSAMVFETQLDEQSIQTEKQKVNELLKKKMKFINLPQAASSQGADSQQGYFFTEQDSPDIEEPDVSDKPDLTLEMDDVNKHECMKNIKRSLLKMKELFASDWAKNGPESPPMFMQELLNEIEGERCHLNIKIFILKLMVNNHALFKPYAAAWFEPICKFMISKQTGGKGFHYFLRDLTTLLIQWSDIATPHAATRPLKELCSKVINSLIKMSADKSKLIFNINIEIIATLLHNWRHLVTIDKVMIVKMLNTPETIDSSHIWKMTAIQVIALACSFNVPILSPQEIQHLKDEDDHSHEFRIFEDPKRRDELLVSLVKMQELRKKQLVFASSEALGKLFLKQSSLGEVVLPALMINEQSNRHDIFVHVIERITREFPQLLNEKRLFVKLVAFINVLTGSMRGAVFKTLDRFIQISQPQQLVEVSRSVTAVANEILADISEENQQNFLILVSTIIRQNRESGISLLEVVGPKLKNLFSSNKNELTRGLFFDLMVFIYDNLPEFKPIAKSAIIRGLSDPSKEIRDRIVAWWDNPARLDLDPFKRVQQLLADIYDQDEEHIWLNNAIYLLLQVSERTADFHQKIFDFPLSDCKFDPLSISTIGTGLMESRQQPVAESYARMQQMIITASQAHHNQVVMQQKVKPAPQLQDIKEEDAEMADEDPSHEEMVIDTVQQKVQESQMTQVTSSQQQKLTARFQGASRVQSSLVAQRFNQLTVQPSQGATASPPVNHKAGSQFEQRGPQINTASSGGNSGFTLMKTSKDDEEETKGSQQETRSIINPISDQRKAIQAKPRGDSVRSQFFMMNEIKYAPIQESQSNMIRLIPDGSMPSHLMAAADGSMPSQIARQEEKRRILREQSIKRHFAQMNKQVNLMRQYRVGDLPDIQIDFKDVLLPLMALVRRDSTIATEVFVELFRVIYINTMDEQRRNSLGLGITSILSQSIKFDYGVVNCMHRVAIELLKIDQFSIDAEIIARTGKHSMSFQTSLILLEETILKGTSIKQAEMKLAQEPKGKRTLSQRTEVQKQGVFGKVSKASKAYWFKLIELYELIGNDDALKGIWRSMEDSDKVLLKEDDGAEMIDEGSYQRTVGLLKQAQSLRAKGSISDGLKKIEEALNSEELRQYFEEQVISEQQNKKFEAMSDLLKWDLIADESLKIHNDKQLHELPMQQSEILIRSLLRKDQNWQRLGKIRQFWLSDPHSSHILDKKFNFEQAILFITESDFDRARFFINKEANDLINQWQDMTKLSQVAQHILVQKIQKIYEMKEFLTVTKMLSIKGQNEMLPTIVDQVQNWVQRQPSFSFDKLAVWDDILTARKLYLRCYDMLLSKDSMEDGLEQKIFSKAEFSDIGAILYAQCAKGAFRMGMFDTCVRYLQTCLDQRSKENKNNLQIILPIIKLKTEQFKQETINLDSSTKFLKLKDIKHVLESKLRQASDKPYNHGLQINTKAYLLKENILRKLLNLTLNDILSTAKPGENQSQTEYSDRLGTLLKEVFRSFDDYQVSTRALEGNLGNNNQADLDMKRAKTSYQFGKLCDRLLRKMESSPLLRQSVADGLVNVHSPNIESKSKKTQGHYEALACTAIKLSFQAMNLGYLRASDTIPRLLDVAANKDNTERVGIEFSKSSKDTPAWIFLRWVNQLVAVINKPEGQIVAEKVTQIARKYPQALFYPFNVIASNIEVNTLSTEIHTTELFNKIKKYYTNKFENLNAWVESLSCLVNPEHRSIQWLTLILDVIKDANWKSKASQLVQMFIDDCAEESKPYIGVQVGSYNRKFAQWMAELIIDKNLQGLSQEKLEVAIKQIYRKVLELPLLQGEKDLQLFSEYLNELDNNDFYNPDQYIEVPGQFEGALTQEPIASKNVKIASVRKKILVLGSIRRPKKLTVHGSNEKDFHLLIKGGEDLRLDQRIQQVFQIMNKVFMEDPSCQNRDIALKTFKVVPVTNRLGTLEWVENTEMLKSIINREYSRLQTGKKLQESKSLSDVRELIKKEFLKKIPGNEGSNDIIGQHLKLLEAQSSLVITGFKKQQQLIPWDLLRKGLENLCLTSSAFITIKNQFIKSIAVFSIASYLIGIGDRHLENFLVDTTDGEVLGIDFGIAFGSGVDLTTPELMPFRLTQQIEGVIAPHPLEGAYKQTMVHTLGALRKNKSLILDTCDIFVKEPLLDWTKEAKKKLNAQLNEDETEISHKTHDKEMEALSFLPKQKIDKVKKKITGVNPVLILKQELLESTHANKKYYKQLIQTIQGPEGSQRNLMLQKKKTYLDVEEQVDCLIEAARDPDVLGRVWLGWSAYI